MTIAAALAVVAVLGAMSLVSLTFIGALALVLAQLDRRRYVRGLHRMRRA